DSWLTPRPKTANNLSPYDDGIFQQTALPIRVVHPLAIGTRACVSNQSASISVVLEHVLPVAVIIVGLIVHVCAVALVVLIRVIGAIVAVAGRARATDTIHDDAEHLCSNGTEQIHGALGTRPSVARNLDDHDYAVDA